jgi:hypothetical protein
MSADIVYSIATGRVRRIVTPSSNLATHSGEGQLTVSTAQYQLFTGPNDIQTFVNTSTGLTPSGDRYVSVDQSFNVLSAHIADPGCGDVAPQTGLPLVAHATANARDLLWGGNVLPNAAHLQAKHRNKNQPLP